jgi:hypothetical protein
MKINERPHYRISTKQLKYVGYKKNSLSGRVTKSHSLLTCYNAPRIWKESLEQTKKRKIM